MSTLNKQKTVAVEVHLIDLTRDGVDTWICTIEVGDTRITPVYLHGKTEDEAVEFARRNLKFSFSPG